jgi:hypothetical protein
LPEITRRTGGDLKDKASNLGLYICRNSDAKKKKDDWTDEEVER